MPDTGWVLAGSGSATTGGTGLAPWTNAANITTMGDSSYAATAATGFFQTSEYLIASNFGFVVPSDATIIGVEARVRRCASFGTQIGDGGLYLWSGSALSGNKFSAQTMTTTFIDRDAGGPTDVWGVTLDSSIVNASSFGVAYVATDVNTKAHAWVSQIWMRIHYEEASGNVYERVDGVWRKGALSERVSGVYRSGKLYEKIAGVWRS